MENTKFEKYRFRTFRKISYFRMNEGFTFIELLTTISIIAILGFISISYLKSYQPNSALKAATRDLAADLRYASEMASTTQINHAVRINIANAHYSIVRLTDPEVSIKEVNIVSPLSISETTLPDNTAQFNALGGATHSGTISIRSEVTGVTMVIDVRPSGYIKIQ